MQWIKSILGAGQQQCATLYSHRLQDKGSPVTDRKIERARIVAVKIADRPTLITQRGNLTRVDLWDVLGRPRHYAL